MTTDAATPTQTARSRVRDDVRRLILSGELQPGTRLTQVGLAKRFGVAQSVIRESLLELQFSGLVEPVDNLGVFVSKLDTDALLQAYDVREMLEGLAARKCCEQASRADLRGLAEMAEQIEEFGRVGQDEQRGQLDREFHMRTIQISQNVVLQRLTEAYHVLGMTVQASRPHDVIHREHVAIVKAIEENRPDDAERQARQHVVGARDAIRQQIADKRFNPRWVVP